MKFDMNKKITPKRGIQLQRRYGISLMRSSAFLLNDYIKTFKEDDYNRYSVESTLRGLLSQIQFEWEQDCKKPVLKPIPDYGDEMVVSEWVKIVETGGFIDYDGHGSLATNKFKSDIVIHPSDITFFKLKLPSWATHVVWFNR